MKPLDRLYELVSELLEAGEKPEDIDELVHETVVEFCKVRAAMDVMREWSEGGAQ